MTKLIFRKLLNSAGYDIIKTGPSVTHSLGNALEPTFLQWLRNRPVKTVLDIGANEGQFAFEAVGLWPEAHIHSFEPLEVPAGIIKAKRGKTKISVHEVALGDANTSEAFRVNSYSASSSFCELGSIHKEAFPNANEQREEQIAIRTLDSMLPELHVNSQIFMKIDVQGYEDKVFNGATETLKHVDYLMCELSFRKMYKNQFKAGAMIQQLEDIGFDYLGDLDYLHHPATGMRLQADGFFINRKLHQQS